VTKTLPVLLVLSLAAVGGCGRGGGSAGPTPSVPAATATATAATAGPSGTPEPVPTQPFGTGPVTVVHSPPVPPVPVLLAIRSAAHPEGGYDRIVFDFQGQLPGYQVRYVSQVVEDGSGRPVTVPGRHWLEITFRPAQAHTDAGSPTVTERARTLGYPMLKAYAIVGDFEAVVSVALGLDDAVGFRVAELAGRVYVDVAA
jgi:hypothetical protein